ncbi:HEAT repeat domain-containing protein [Methanohalophilus profundi]|uniref:HEAT repeat domain-containing protein n=1 Tax=Methanohalophilus profundi TaxID=2138083 RepID=UPI0013EAFACA|nr:HEAT repeat domain-containing protein [Methanohalophilus profundi]
MIEALENEDVTVRKYASMGLLVIADERAIKPLIHVLSDDDIRVRNYASQALGDIGEDAIEPLVQILDDENNFNKKRLIRATAKALGFIKSPKIVYPLIKTLSINDMYVKESACLALGVLGDPLSIEPLKVCLNDKHKKVQVAAKKSLKKIS